MKKGEGGDAKIIVLQDKIIEYKVGSAHLNVLCYCSCLYSGFYNMPIDGTHTDQGYLL